MALRLSSALIWTLLVVTVSSQVSQKAGEASVEKKDSLVVSKELLQFMMGCSSAAYKEEQGARVPVHVTDIDAQTGKKSQRLTLVNINDLQDSLKSTVYSDSVIRHIMGRIQEALDQPEKAKGDEDAPSFRYSDCSVENNISVSVPPQELNVFNERLTQILQQNSRLLLEQFNTFITYKLNNLYDDMEKLVTQRIALLSERVEEVLSKLEQTGTKPTETVEPGIGGMYPDTLVEPVTTLRPPPGSLPDDMDSEEDMGEHPSTIGFPTESTPDNSEESAEVGNARVPIIPPTRQNERLPNRGAPYIMSDLSHHLQTPLMTENIKA